MNGRGFFRVLAALLLIAITIGIGVAVYNAGVTALQANNMEEAVKSLSVANSLYRKRPEAMVTLGSVYVQQGNLAAAEAVFKDALAVMRGPERAKQTEEELAVWAEDELTVSMRLANIYAGQEKFAEAEQVYRQLLESHQVPNVTVAWQGGEPTLMGLDFFRHTLELIERHKRPEQVVDCAGAIRHLAAV